MLKAAKIKVLFVIVLLVTVSYLKAEGKNFDYGLPYIVNYFKVDDDIRNTRVNDIVQLPEGLILLAGQPGLIVYDGNSWGRVLDNSFLSLAYDKTNKILFAGTERDFGYIVYDQALENFKYVSLSKLSPRFIKNTWSIKVVNNAAYFFVNKRYVFKYDYNGLHFIDLKGFQAQSAYKAGDYLFVVDDSVGIGILTTNGFLVHSTIHKDIYSQSISAILPAGTKNHFWVITRKGNLYKYSFNDDKFILINGQNNCLKNSIIREAIKLSDGNLALRTGTNGIFVIDTLGREILHISHENGLESNTLTKISQDQFGNLWVSSSRFVSQIFYAVPYRFATESLGFEGDISDLAVFNGNMVVSTSTGMFYLAPGAKEFKKITSKYVFYKRNLLPLQLNGNDYLLAAPRWNILLIDTLFRIRQLKRIFQIYDLTQDRRGNIYALSYDSLYEFRLSENLRLVKKRSAYLPYLISSSVIYGDSLLFLYSAPINVLIKVNVEKEDFEFKNVYLYNIQKIYSLKKFNDSLLIFATDRGVLFFDPRRNIFKSGYFSKLNKYLHAEKPRDILVDTNCIWILTDKDIIRFDTENKSFKIFPFQTKSRFYSQKLMRWGKLLVCSNPYSITMINEDSFKSISEKMKEIPILTYIQIDQRKYYLCDESDILKKRNDSVWILDMSLPYQKTISVKASLISSYFSKVYYRYKLDNGSWQPWTTNPLITLAQLRGGKHQVLIGMKSDVSSETYIVKLIFKVKVPFYRSKLAYVFYILLFFFLLYLILSRKLHRERHRRILLEHLVKRHTKQLEEKNRLLEEQYKKLNTLTQLLLKQKEELSTQNEQLRLSNLELRQLSLVAQKTTNSVLILDKKGRIEWWNEGFAQLFKYKFNLSDHNINKVIKNIRPDVFKRIKDFDKSQGSIVYTTREILPDGQGELWYKTTITPVIDENGEIFRFVVLDVDISEIKLAEKQIKKQKEELERQTKELMNINQQLHEHKLRLEIHNREMLSSLEYAKKIQTALLPREEIRQIFPKHFILERPKEIVSGDFYYFTIKRNKVVYAIADGTGHGVPGAFMSVLGLTLLKDAIERNERNLLPSNILNTLRVSIIKALHQGSANIDVKDGLDIALGVIDPFEEILLFAGANIPINIVRNREVLIEVRGDRMPIGIHEFSDIPFSLERLELVQGDRIYLYTDGYVDQFGGPDNKRYKRTRFKKFLLNIQDLPLEKHREAIEQELDEWVGSNDQIDDITVIGFEIDFEHIRKIIKESGFSG